MKVLSIGGRTVSDGKPCFIIAEIGINHNGSMKLASRLIDMARDAGADCVKFQMRDLEALYTKNALEKTINEDLSVQYTLSLLRRFQLSPGQMAELAGYAREAGIMFLCTPWDPPSVRELEQIGVPAYKTASADLTNLELLGVIADTGKPVIVSTGMSSIEEIEKTVSFLKARGTEFALLHCNSTYPAPYKDINLRFMLELKKYGVPVGYSGHERGIAVSEAAVALGACIVERHFTLDRTMEGPDHAASLEFPGLQKLVRDIRNIEESLGTSHRWLTRGELLNRETLAKSLVAATDIPEGAVITPAMIAAKSPGKGIAPQRAKELLNRPARRHIKADEFFLESDLAGGVEARRRFAFKRKWGLVTRYHDADEFVRRFSPDFLEFHLSYDDVDHDFSLGGYGCGLVVHAPELFRGDSLLDLCTGDEKRRRLSIDNLQRVVEVAHRLKAHFEARGRVFIITHVGGFSIDEPVRDKRPLYDNLLRSLGELDEGEAEVMLENMPPFPWLFGGQRFHNVLVSPGDTAEFCTASARKLCLDTSHAALACNHLKVALPDFVKAVRPHVAHLHVSDGAGVDGEGLQIGEGEIDFAELASALAGCDAPFVPEVWQGHKFGGEGFRKALERLSAFGF